MNHFHKPTDEKRMVAILAVERYQEWLDAKSGIMAYMVPFDAQQLRAVVPESVNPSFL
jgi:putative SOS response-associated peptidase YedK